MMDVVPSKDGKITEIYEKDGKIFLKSESGLLRVIPEEGGIVRISFSVDGEFSDEQGKDYADYSGSIKYELFEREVFLSIKTSDGEVRINKASGAVSFYNPNGNELLSEREDYPRELERITLYRTINTDAAKVQEIVTPDGIKKKISAADKEERGYAYKTRTFFEFDEKEILLGFGQGEHGEWNLRKTTYYVHQANKKIGIPMFVSSKNYGILLSTSSTIIFTENEDRAFVQADADFYLDYYFLFGKDLFNVVRNYRRITGKAAMLPRWAYGYIQSKERYESQDDILKTAREFRDRNLGIDCMVLDWMSWEDGKWGQKSFDAKRFGDPKAMTDELHKLGIRFMISIWPNMSPCTDNNEEFREKKLLLPGTDIYNAFEEEGREFYWSQVERGLYPAGVDAWWCDSSEPITPEWEHLIEPSDSEKYHEYKNDAGNIMPLELANAYGKFHARAIWEGQRKCSDVKRVVNLTRSGWAGSQKYGTILWSGDISASWKTLRQQVRAGLSFVTSGMPYWTLDAGAFFVKRGIQWFWNGDYKDGIDENYKKLYVRWLEYAAFLPMFRAHGTDIEREPWAFGDNGNPYYEAICKTIRERYRLIPYLYSLGAQVHFVDAMLMRPLMFDFGGDENAIDIWDQYMLGDSLMICPVLEDSYRRKVYLPKEAGWYNYHTGEYYEGGQAVECDASLDEIPVFVKAGSVIPTVEPITCTDEIKGSDIELLVFPGADARFKLYEDSGDGYGYENGEYCFTEIVWNDAEKSLSYKTKGDARFRNGTITYTVMNPGI